MIRLTKYGSRNRVPSLGIRNKKCGSLGDVSGVTAPAGHQDGLVNMELLPVHLDGDVGQDVPAAEAVEVEQDVACVARELNAAISGHGHSVEI